jgi:hypothetical protein
MTKCNLKQVPQYTYFLIVTFYCLKNNSIKEKEKKGFVYGTSNYWEDSWFFGWT